MIDDPVGGIEYEECGSGPTLVFVPGSCSTGAAWRPVISSWDGQFHCVTTSLLGYGKTAERRTASDYSIAREAEIVEAVVRRTARPIHLVGHSFGGLVAVAVALRRQVPVKSLVIVEAPAVELLRECSDGPNYRGFREMTSAYFAAYNAGDKEAIASMIDFYGGAGTYASWPPRVRTYAIEKTPVNILDWATAYGFQLSPALLAGMAVPTLIVWGGASHPAVQSANALFAQQAANASSVIIQGATHFMLATHSQELGSAIAQHVSRTLGVILPSTSELQDARLDA
jgi:pimeloyl-ACP methyl ester carboxylesterase